MTRMSPSDDDPMKDEDEDWNKVRQVKQRNGNGNSKKMSSPSSRDGQDETFEMDSGLPTAEKSERRTKELSALRSRRHYKKPRRQSQEDMLQRSNVPGSSNASLSSEGREVDEQLSRLKSACQYAWVNFLQDCPFLINNNVETKNETKEKDEPGSIITQRKLVPRRKPPLLSTPDLTKPAISKDNFRQITDKTSAKQSLKSQRSTSILGLYKFFNLIATVVLMFLKLVLVLFIILFILYCLMVLHKPTQGFVSRYTQDLIYPLMRTIRFGSLPIVSRFPRLHEFYEDACLLANPFFEINDVSCWPCESVRHVIDLTGFSNFTSGYYHSGIPFIVKDAFTRKVDVYDIYKLYLDERKLFGNVQLESSHEKIKTLDDMMDFNIKPGNFFSGNLHVGWKINRAQYARQFRRYFSRPYYIPVTTEVSVQHFLFIDEPGAEQYELPVTEFANVFVMQASGKRLIVLVPMRHCQEYCKAISIVLQTNDVLFYNWLFWKPISFPMTALEETSELSITYIGSFY